MIDWNNDNKDECIEYGEKIGYVIRRIEDILERKITSVSIDDQRIAFDCPVFVQEPELERS